METLDQKYCEGIKREDVVLIAAAYSFYLPKVTAILRKERRGRSSIFLVEDLYQSAWVEYLVKVKKDKEKPPCDSVNLAYYIAGIARNIERNATRKDGRQSYIDDPRVIDQQCAPSVFQVLEQLDRKQMLEAAMSKLPSKYREIVELTYYKQLSNKEIEDELGISNDNVRARQSRALDMLLDILTAPSKSKTEENQIRRNKKQKTKKGNENKKNESEARKKSTQVGEERLPTRTLLVEASDDSGAGRNTLGDGSGGGNASEEVRGHDRQNREGHEAGGIREKRRGLQFIWDRHARSLRAYRTVTAGMAAAIALLIAFGFLVTDPETDVEDLSVSEDTLWDNPTDSVPPSDTEISEDGKHPIPPMYKLPTKEALRLPPKRYVESPPLLDSVQQESEDTAKYSWERKLNDRDPRHWLRWRGIAIPDDSAVSDLTWGSVIRGLLIPEKPIRSEKAIWKTKSELAILLFEAEHWPDQTYLHGDSLWVFQGQNLKELAREDVWVTESGSGDSLTLHIGREKVIIKKDDAKGL